MGICNVLNDTATLFNYAGEADMKAVYIKTVFNRVGCEDKRNTAASAKGETPKHEAALYIFDARSRSEGGKTYLPYNEWLVSGHKENYWTLSPKDYFVKGVPAVTDPAEIFGAHKITDFSHFGDGSPRMRHWEIHGS